MGRGPLVRVELEPGRWVKMHKAHAIEAGLLEEKKREPTEDKMLRPGEDKSQESIDEVPETAQERDAELESVESGDDLTEIPGVGPSTAEDLRAAGYETLDDVRSADLSGLDGRARDAIERWRDG